MRAIPLTIVVLLFSSSALHASEGILWHHDLDSAKRAAAQLNRPILLHFWSRECPPCVKLEHEVYSRPEVKRALESMFVLVKLNVDDFPATASNFGVRSWPADVVLSPDGTFQLLKCPAAPQQYIAQLEQVGRGINQGALNRSALAGSVQPGAAGTSNVTQPQSPIVQTSGQAPAIGQSPATAANNPYTWTGSASQIATYDFRSAGLGASGGQAVAATNHQAQVQTPVAPFAQQPQPTQPSPQAGQQAIAGYAQPPASGQFEMVAAVDAPSIGLDGCCPVQLHKVRTSYTKGDPRYGVVHRGRTYLFSGPAEQQEFLRDPDRYSPVMGGNDPVLLFDQGWQVAGERQCGLFFGDRVYLFANDQSKTRFLAEKEESQRMSRPNRYAEAIYQAENPARGMMR